MFERCLDTVTGGGRLADPNGIGPAAKSRHGIEVTAHDPVADPAAFERRNRAVQYARLQVPIAGIVAPAEATKAH